MEKLSIGRQRLICIIYINVFIFARAFVLTTLSTSSRRLSHIRRSVVKNIHHKALRTSSARSVFAPLIQCRIFHVFINLTLFCLLPSSGVSAGRGLMIGKPFKWVSPTAAAKSISLSINPRIFAFLKALPRELKPIPSTNSSQFHNTSCPTYMPNRTSILSARRLLMTRTSLALAPRKRTSIFSLSVDAMMYLRADSTQCYAENTTQQQEKILLY